MKQYKLSIITPEETIFSGMINSLILPSVVGRMEVLAEHAPAFIMLDKGIIKVSFDGDTIKSYKVESGYVQITHNDVKILPENIIQI